mgnify:FL=1
MKYWIKLFIEMLDDPKVATLPDRLYRRWVEVMMLAGKADKEGEIPNTKQCSWSLRLDEVTIETDFEQLAIAGLIERKRNTWRVINYKKRQAPVPDSERYRELRKRNPQYDRTKDKRFANETFAGANEMQTPRLENTDTDTDTEQIQNRIEDDGEFQPRENENIYRLYESNIGPLTPIISDRLIMIEQEYPEDWIKDAFHTASLNNVRKLSYVISVLDNRKNGNGNWGNTNSKKGKTSTSELDELIKAGGIDG